MKQHEIANTDSKEQISEGVSDFRTYAYSVDAKGNTSLHRAALLNQPKLIEELIRKYNLSVDLTNDNGESPLYDAVDRGHEEAVAKLLEMGADPNLGREKPLLQAREKPLLQAVLKGDHKVCELLLNEGADPNDLNGRPLLRAVLKRDHKICELLLNKGAKVNTLVADHIDAFNEFSYRQAFHGRFCRSYTPLLVAILNDDVVLVRKLIERGANVNRMVNWEHPLVIAARLDFTEIVKELSAAGADLSSENIIDLSDLCNKAIAVSLLRAGAQVRHPSSLSINSELKQQLGGFLWYAWEVQQGKTEVEKLARVCAKASQTKNKLF